MSIQAWTCATCADSGRKGYCAPLRCYCGHETCHAAGSREARTESVADVAYLPTQRRASSWDTREESTWIDKM
jgi:hypothetical protein